MRGACHRHFSQGGANVSGGPSLQTGTRGTPLPDGVGFVLPFTIRDSNTDALHLVFELGETTAAKFGAVLQRLA